MVEGRIWGRSDLLLCVCVLLVVWALIIGLYAGTAGKTKETMRERGFVQSGSSCLIIFLQRGWFRGRPKPGVPMGGRGPFAGQRGGRGAS